MTQDVVVHRTTFEYHVGGGSVVIVDEVPTWVWDSIQGRHLAEANGGPWVPAADVSAVLTLAPEPDPVTDPLGSVVELVPPRDWKWTGDVLSEMTQGEKDARDATEATAVHDAIEARIKKQVLGDPLNGLTVTSVAAALVITTNIQNLVTDDETTVVADPDDEKFVKVCYVYNEDTDTFGIVAYEKTTGQYAALTPPEYLIRDIKEFSVGAAGTELVEV